MWIASSHEEGVAIRELNNLSDRAAAIVASALLENRIEKNLKSCLMDYKKNSKESSVHTAMFENSGPLATFSAKINMGFMLGLYTAPARDDLHIIRDIRNDFAHELSIHNFDDGSIAARCANIKWFTKFVFPRGMPEADAPQGLNVKMFEENLDEQLANPRARYILAIRFYTSAIVSMIDVHRGASLCRPRI